VLEGRVTVGQPCLSTGVSRNINMTSRKHFNRLRQLAALAFFAWLLCSFSLMGLWWIKGGSGLPKSAKGQPVPAHRYNNAVETIDALVFNVVPALTAGYAVIGLGLLWVIHKAKTDESG